MSIPPSMVLLMSALNCGDMTSRDRALTTLWAYPIVCQFHNVPSREHDYNSCTLTIPCNPFPTYACMSNVCVKFVEAECSSIALTISDANLEIC